MGAGPLSVETLLAPCALLFTVPAFVLTRLLVAGVVVEDAGLLPIVLVLLVAGEVVAEVGVDGRATVEEGFVVPFVFVRLAVEVDVAGLVVEFTPVL